jgi:hypothetical protein
MPDTALLALTLGLSVISFGTGRTNALTGLVHPGDFRGVRTLLVVPSAGAAGGL